MYFVKKHISTFFLMIGYLIIQLFLGYINFLKTDNFHILTAGRCHIGRVYVEVSPMSVIYSEEEC